MDLAQVYWTRGILLLAGVKVRCQGLNRIADYRGKAIVYMFSHASNLDVRQCLLIAHFLLAI
jgi:1-acyl-sn-glycerol-3-phosphate acyltransferase